ncbi:hypothetical protein FACS1894132_10530 [Clostridia bacterium]|nr:hypothetical protein FACS1894132_10530 [Clostridia bacterium]
MENTAKKYVEPPRTEKINGQIVAQASATYGHNNIVGNIYNEFRNFLKGKKCKVAMDVDTVLDDEQTFRPDLFVLCDPNKILKKDGKWLRVVGAPDLVVEVASPSTAKNDLGTKKDIYEKYGVREYWIVFPMERTILVYLLNDDKFDEAVTYNNNYVDEYSSPEDLAVYKPIITTSLYGDDLQIKLDDIFDME